MRAARRMLAAPWRVYGAACLERYPRLTPAAGPLDADMALLRAEVQAENSALSQYELELARREAEEEKKRKKRKQEDQQVSMMTEAEERKFVPGCRETDDEPRNVARRLAEKVFLVVRQSDGQWGWPRAEVAGDADDLRSAAERALGEVVDVDTTKTYFISNAPSHCSTAGDIKTFALRSVLVSREPIMRQSDAYTDFMWLTREEILQSPDMPKDLASFLF